MDDPEGGKGTIRCCFLGDAAVGKTLLILTSVKKEGGQEPMFFHHATTMDIDGVPTRVELCDTQVLKADGRRTFFFLFSLRLQRTGLSGRSSVSAWPI